MKGTILLLLTLIAFGFSAESSAANQEHDNISARKKNPNWFNKGGHWGGVSFGYAGLVSGMGDWGLSSDARFMKQDPNSIYLNINPINFEIYGTKNFAIVSGLGFEFNNFRFSKNISLIEDADGNVIPDPSYHIDGINLKKSKLSTSYISIPLLAEFRIPNKRGNNFYMYGGIVGSWGYNKHTKVKYSENGKTEKDKNKNLPCPNFRYGYNLSVGYEHVGIFMAYYPQSIFTKNSTPDVKQINIGLTVNFGRKWKDLF